jgi:hypothetical protein
MKETSQKREKVTLKQFITQTASVTYTLCVTEAAAPSEAEGVLVGEIAPRWVMPLQSCFSSIAWRTGVIAD